MPFSQCLVAEDYSLTDVTSQNVRFAFVIGLPFRLRVGQQYHFAMEEKDYHLDLWLRNRIHVPHGMSLEELLPKVRDFKEFWTDALVVIQNPKVTDDALNALRNSNPDSDNFQYPRPSSEIFDALQAVNNFIVAYSTATGELFGGTPLQIFRIPESLDYFRWELTIVGPAQEMFTAENINKMFELRPEREIQSIIRFTGKLDDLLKEELKSIDHVLALHQNYIFYEFAFEAKVKMISGDYVGALLMAVAALEGAHAAYVGDVILSKLPSNASRELPEDYLRELGMSLSNQLTPYILMDENDRPSPDLIQGATLGLKFRNEIMHALRNRRGDYRTRSRTNNELSEAYSAVLHVYDCYRQAFEKRINKSFST